MVTERIETWAADEYTPGVSAGAAARQLIRSLGCAGAAPTLKRMLEDLLAEANRASHDRHMILSDFEKAAPADAKAAQLASFHRSNPHLQEV